MNERFYTQVERDSALLQAMLACRLGSVEHVLAAEVTELRLKVERVEALARRYEGTTWNRFSNLIGRALRGEPLLEVV